VQETSLNPFLSWFDCRTIEIQFRFFDSMATHVSQFRVIPLHKAIEHYFELSLYLLVLTGFGALASTGGLGLTTTLLVGAALAVRGYLLAERRRFVISERWTTPLTIAYFVFFIADFFLFSRSFLTATVHLALFAVVIRMFSLRRERDHVMLAILAFLMVLASSVLTVDSVFLLFFVGFMLMAVTTFVLMEMRRSGRAANIQARHSHDLQEHRHLAFSLARVTPALMLMIMAGATAVFFVLPRMSAGYMGAYSFGTDFSTGFSDRVQLGRIGQIQQSNAVVMHIQIDGDKVGVYDLRWRGVALADFDGHSWSNPRQQFVLQRGADNSFPIPSLGTKIARPSGADGPSVREKIIHYRVVMEPIGTNVFFLAPWARTVKGAYETLSVDAGAAVYDLDGQHQIGVYEADSDIGTPSPDQLRTASENYPPQVTGNYLRLPVIDPRIPPLAAKIAGSASSSYDKASAIEHYLKTHFGYTLQLPRTAVKDPLANFLFERKQGHCEYFASSMAVMLRTLGIPSRVVNGFRSDEFNDLTGNYVVRAKNAHAWVEAFFPGYGWQSFDPTPAGNSGTPQGWGRVALYLDAMSSFWREWIISYDTSHQYILGQAALGGTRATWEQARAWARGQYESMLAWARRGQKHIESSPRRWAGLGAGIAILLLLLGNAARLARIIHEKRLRSHPERFPEQAASMWYERMARSLARWGMQRQPGNTPQEFVKKIDDERLRTRVAQFTQAYESARFGNSADDAERLPELYEEVVSATGK
jgi:transglutaminase-like putative cysteine protease